MANLTEISIATRKLFVWLAVVFVGYIILKILVSFGVDYWKTANPPTLPPPDVRFNKITAPKFTKIATSSSGLKFTLENIEGRPPETTTAAKVYRMPKKLPSLLSSQKAKSFATKLGFISDPQALTSTSYLFTDPQNPLRTLLLDTVNMNFKLSYDYGGVTQIFNSGRITSSDQAINEVKNLIRFNNLFDETIINGKVTTDLLKYDSVNKQFIPASSLSSTSAIRINFFRQDIDKLKILSSSFNQSYIYAIYVPSSVHPTQIIELAYIFWPIAFDDFATYPLKSAASAWADLVDGYAAVVSMGNSQSDHIVIRNIYLAYFDSEEPQAFLQPIFVFEGDNNFVAYLPAIEQSWLE